MKMLKKEVEDNMRGENLIDKNEYNIKIDNKDNPYYDIINSDSIKLNGELY